VKTIFIAYLEASGHLTGKLDDPTQAEVI